MVVVRGKKGCRLGVQNAPIERASRAESRVRVAGPAPPRARGTLERVTRVRGVLRPPNFPPPTTPSRRTTTYILLSSTFKT